MSSAPRVLISLPSMTADRVKNPQSRGITGHLDVCILKDILVAIQNLRLLVEIGERLDLDRRRGAARPDSAGCSVCISRTSRPMNHLGRRQGAGRRSLRREPLPGQPCPTTPRRPCTSQTSTFGPAGAYERVDQPCRRHDVGYGHPDLEPLAHACPSWLKTLLGCSIPVSTWPQLTWNCSHIRFSCQVHHSPSRFTALLGLWCSSGIQCGAAIILFREEPVALCFPAPV
jgi:hypothetical protein